MLKIKKDSLLLTGPGGQLSAPVSDVILPKFAMLYEGECGGLGPLEAADKYGYCKQRYFQLRHLFQTGGILALANQKRGPKSPSRRTAQLIQQVVRHRFLDPEASAEVIAQKLRQSGSAISTRSVERVIAQFGLQKKTPRLPTHSGAGGGGNLPNQTAGARRKRRS
jgi:hypothetical protein